MPGGGGGLPGWRWGGYGGVPVAMAHAVPDVRVHGGDARLARLLAAAGSAVTVAEAKEIAAGALAAPPSFDDEGWMAMVTPRPPAALKAALAALKAALAGGEGAPPAPAPAWRLQALRAELAARGLDGFVVPRSDEHQGEEVAAAAERLRWLTGFNGSAGLAVVLRTGAAMFVDGRYTLQVEEQVRGEDFERHHLLDSPPEAWIGARLAGGRLGYDPWLHTVAGRRALARGADKAGGTLVACESNPVDAVWTDRPPPPLQALRPQPLEFCGRAADDKIAEVAAALGAAGEAAALLSDPASIAWLLNLRGGDLPATPVALAYALVEAGGGVSLFIDRRKATREARAWLPDCVTLHPPQVLAAAIDAAAEGGAKLRLDAGTAACWFADRIDAAGGQAVAGSDPCALPRARKHAVEIAGAVAAHIRDGAALCTFLAWLDRKVAEGEEVDELSAAARLERCRRAVDGYRGPSFETISAFGPSGAHVHYSASPAGKRRLRPGSLYLVDSGGQYADGTTDVTRTIAIGTPDADQRRHFTAVLKGHIALARVRFPPGTSGAQLDALARAPLWAIGADFDHGTGHGVGSHLAVHEGPQRIARTGWTPLEAGMIVSNEPGYYRAGAWGIRIENLVAVEEAGGDSSMEPATPAGGARRPMLRLRVLTRAPIDLRLVDAAALEAGEIDWLDAYHADVRRTLTPLLDEETAAWLRQATRPLAGGGSGG